MGDRAVVERAVHRGDELVPLRPDVLVVLAVLVAVVRLPVEERDDERVLEQHRVGVGEAVDLLVLGEQAVAQQRLRAGAVDHDVARLEQRQRVVGAEGGERARRRGPAARPSMRSLSACSIVFSGQKPTTQSAIRPARSGGISRRNAMASSSSGDLEHRLVVDVVDRDLAVARDGVGRDPRRELHHPRAGVLVALLVEIHLDAVDGLEQRGEQEAHRPRADDVHPAHQRATPSPRAERHDQLLARPGATPRRWEPRPSRGTCPGTRAARPTRRPPSAAARRGCPRRGGDRTPSPSRTRAAARRDRSRARATRTARPRPGRGRGSTRQLSSALARCHIGVSTNVRMLVVSSRWSSSGIPRNWKHSGGPPRSRARSAVAALSPPPALWPPTAMRAGSTPSSAALVVQPRRARRSSPRARPGTGARARGGTRRPRPPRRARGPPRPRSRAPCRCRRRRSHRRGCRAARAARPRARRRPARRPAPGRRRAVGSGHVAVLDGRGRSCRRRRSSARSAPASPAREAATSPKSLGGSISTSGSNSGSKA